MDAVADDGGIAGTATGMTGGGDVNGDDDMGPLTNGDVDEGGGMYGGPSIPVAEPDDDDLIRRMTRRSGRRHSRPKFRVERKARRTPR